MNLLNFTLTRSRINNEISILRAAIGSAWVIPLLIPAALFFNCTSSSKNNRVQKSNAVSIQIAVDKPVRLVRYKFPHDAEYISPPALDGSITISVKNISRQAVTLWNPETHGLIFININTGKKYVIIHPCQCVKDLRNPKIIKLPPGSANRIKIDEWGCNSFWIPPPPGEYTVHYRILPLKSFYKSIREVNEKSPPGIVALFRKLFIKESFWTGNFSSEPLRIKLIKPVKLIIEDR